MTFDDYLIQVDKETNRLRFIAEKNKELIEAFYTDSKPLRATLEPKPLFPVLLLELRRSFLKQIRQCRHLLRGIQELILAFGQWIFQSKIYDRLNQSFFSVSKVDSEVSND